MRKFLVLLPLLLVPSLVSSSLIISNPEQPSTKFYTNESVYIYTTSNISVGEKEVRVYVVSDSNAWNNGTTLQDIRGSFSTISTNSSGYIPLTLIWSSELKVGKYDIVLDINSNGIYENNVDILNSSTKTGFEVVELPLPTLTVEKGSATKKDLEIPAGNTSYIPMLQLVLKATLEDIILEKLYLAASGSGDDKDVKVVLATLDSNSNGVYDQGELIVGFGKYLRDNGLLELPLKDFTIKNSTSVTLLISYQFEKEAVGTYSFSIISYEARSPSNTSVKVVNGEQSSRTLTIKQLVTTSTTYTSTTTTYTSTTLPPTTSTTTSVPSSRPPKPQNSMEQQNFILMMIAAIAAIVPPILVVLLLMKR